MKLFKKMDDNGSASAVGAVISVLVAIIIGILVYYKIAGQMTGMSAAGVTAAAGVNTTANTVFTLMPIIAIVLIASIILAVVTNFGRGGA